MATRQERNTNFTLKPDSIEDNPHPEDIPRAQLQRDVIVESGEIKRLIREILKKNGLRLYSVCEKYGYNYDRIKMWLNSRKPRYGKEKASQEEIIGFCKFLGISVRVTLLVSSVAFDDDLKFIKRRAKIAKNNSVYDNYIEKEDGKSNGQEEEA